MQFSVAKPLQPFGIGDKKSLVIALSFCLFRVEAKLAAPEF